jgi:hypothetical protein
MTLDAYLTTRSDRCSGCGAHVPTQGCRCDTGEWAVFVAALRAASKARTDGRVHQSAVRPLIRGRIQPKHIGQSYKRAIREGLLTPVDHEKSDDEIGGNSHRLEPVYELRAA